MAREECAGVAGVRDGVKGLDSPSGTGLIVFLAVVVVNADDYLYALSQSAHHGAKGFRAGRTREDKAAFNDAIAALEVCAVAFPNAAFHFLGLRFLAVLAAALKAPLSG